MKLYTLIALLTLLWAPCLSAQTAASLNPSLPVADGTPIPLKRAVITGFIGNGSIEIQETGKAPERFTLATQPVFIAADGKMFEPSSLTLRNGTRVLVHFMPDGGRMIIDRVILQ
jgi:hypothetical protein